MNGTEICEICGEPGANIAYFRTGMTAVVYRHSECDRDRSEMSAHKHRQEWGIEQWLKSE
jgi:hypothetical protein